MKIEVISAQIGEHRAVPLAAADPFLDQGVGRDLHDRVVYASVGHGGQQGLEFDRFGCGKGGRLLASLVAIIDCTNHAGRPAHGQPDGLQQVGRGGFAARAGHADQRQPRARLSVKPVGHQPQQTPWRRATDQAERPGIARQPPLDGGVVVVGHDQGGGSAPQGVVYERCAVGLRPRQGKKYGPGPHLP